MFVSTTVVSTRSASPHHLTLAGEVDQSRQHLLQDGLSSKWRKRISVLASGTRSPSMRQKAR